MLKRDTHRYVRDGSQRKVFRGVIPRKGGRDNLLSGATAPFPNVAILSSHKLCFTPLFWIGQIVADLLIGYAVCCSLLDAFW